MKKLLPRLALAAAAMACMTVAQATVITFDSVIDTTLAPFAPLLGHNDEILTQGYWLDPWSTKATRQDGDLVGALIDGNDVVATCSGIVCPAGNPTQFLGIFNDAQLYFGQVGGGVFNLAQFSASFIAASGDAVPPLALILRVDGYSGATKVATQDFQLPGPVAGNYSFATYSVNAAYGSTLVDQVVMYGYNCNAAGSCARASDKAQFAVDNITVVPEPAEWLLMGLGLVAVGAVARRRSGQVA